MASFHWDNHFITGLNEVDEQHHHLVDIINKFGDLVTQNKVNADDIEMIFKELVEYTQYHFDEEEALMAKLCIDQRHKNKHIEIHKKFVVDVVSMHSEISSGHASTTPKDLLDFLVNWLAFHILVTDKNMANQINAIQAGVGATEAYEKEEHESDDATRPLVNALSDLFDHVSARNKELVKLNQSLEEKVTERTKELSEANKQLEELSLTDALTELPNRRYATQCLSKLWQESIKNDTPITCMMIDADHFKEINDNYGHDSGDTVLFELSKTLQHSVRNDDIVSRLGGDEFLIICPATNKEGGMYLAEQVLKKVTALKVPTGSGAWHGSVSIGVAIRTDDMKNYEELIKLADESVYLAKQAGKCCVRAKH